MKKHISVLLMILTACFIFTSFSSCSGSDKKEIQREHAVSKLLKKHKIKIAVAGPWSMKSNYLMDGLTLACEEVNTNGGVLGAQLELIPFDDANNIADGEKTAYQICDDPQIGIVIGHTVSDISIRNSLIYYYYGLLQFSPLSTNYKLTNNNIPTVFRNISIDFFLGKAAADFCNDKGWKHIIVYNLNNDYGDGLASAFESQAGSDSMTIVDRVEYANTDKVKDTISDIQFWQKNYDFDAIFIAGSMPQTGEIVSLIRDAGITQPIIGGDTFDDWIFFKTVNRSTIDEVYCVSNYNNDVSIPAYAQFKKNFRARFGHNDDQDAYHGYDAVKVIADAIKRTGSANPTAVARTLHSDIVWNELAGPYSLDHEGDCIGHSVIVKKAEKEEFVKVAEIQP